jgi:DNA-directed RNA polymerase alpha subunit
MTPENYYRERSAIICKMRVEEKKTLQAIADLFDIGRERVRQIIAKAERLKAEEERRRAADQDTLGAMQLSIRLRNCLHNENYPESTRVIDVFEDITLAGMMRIPNMGKQTIKEFTDKAEAIVGADVIQRWLDGRPLRD